MEVNYNPNSAYKTYTTKGRLSIYNHPIVEVDNAGKLNDDNLNENSNNVIILSGNTFDLNFNLKYKNNDSLSNTKSYRYEIFKYNPVTKVFNQKVYESENFSNINEFGQRHNKSNFKLDGDYIIKNYFTFKDNNLFKNLIFKEGNGDTSYNRMKMGYYNNDEDNYLVIIEKPEKPILFSHNRTYNEKDVIKSINLKPNGTNKIVVDERINGEIILTFNGLVLTKNLDYKFENNIITLEEKTRKDDVINIFYTSKGEVMSVDVIDIVDVKNTKNVNFNQEENRYELFVEKGLGGKKEIITINGLVLTPNKDYVRSISDDSKIILMGELIDGDLLNIIYTPKINTIGEIQNINPSIGWYVSKNPNSKNGFFKLELSKFHDFRNIEYSKVVEYDNLNSVYKVDLDFNLESFVNYHYRVVNQKIHTTVNGSKIKLREISDQYHFKIINNQINSY